MKTLLFCALLITLMGCQPNTNSNTSTPVHQAAISNASAPVRAKAKFEPEDGKVLLFVGQELNAVGGLDDYKDGYLDHFKTPAGWTTYTDLSPGDTSFNFVLKGLDGVWQSDNWGDSTYNMSLQVADPDFKNMAVAIGLWFTNHEAEVATGALDEMIDKLGNYLKSLAPRPVFLRVGYEFDGHLWNHYDRNLYLTAYKRIKDRMDALGATNIAYVWQSTGFVSDQYMLEDWYPGDEYVDWCAFSFFSRWKEQEMIEFARKKGKPVFIAEATPTISDYTVKFDGKTKETILSHPEQAVEAWEKWFTPFFNTIHENPDVVKAVSYINCYWLSHEMWKDNPTFQKIDARLQSSKSLSEKWKKEVYQEKYLHASPTLFEELNTNL